MTHTPDFNEIAADLANHGDDFYAQYQESRAILQRQNPGGVDVTKIGQHAWQQITPVQRAHALDGLFQAYFMKIYDEERAARLDTAAADETKTYLETDDVYLLHDALSGSHPIGEDTEVNRVCASALCNVLAELELLQHRLAMTKDPAQGDARPHPE